MIPALVSLRDKLRDSVKEGQMTQEQADVTLKITCEQLRVPLDKVAQHP
jgi:hypothetical protein